MERDFEDAILRELKMFVLELGAGFSFIARQKRIQLDGKISTSTCSSITGSSSDW
jgi:predicted nuclease of restriction endonuclease-like (RecB) superfamily